MEDNKDEMTKDITITDTGAMQEDGPDLAEPTNDEVSSDARPQSPQVVMDVTPPPHDDLAEEAARPEIAVSASTETFGTGVSSETPVAIHAHKTGKGLIVAISVVLALVLASIAVLVFVKTNKTAKQTTSSTAPAAQKQTTDTTQSSVQPVASAEIDATTKDIDTTLSALDENKDFNTTDLSDSSLGL